MLTGAPVARTNALLLGDIGEGHPAPVLAEGDRPQCRSDLLAGDLRDDVPAAKGIVPVGAVRPAHDHPVDGPV